MYRYVITLAILLSCTLAASEMDLNVMSFNVRYGTAMDGDNAWPHRKDILVNTIKKYAPDIIGVQECLAFQADYIVEKLPEYRWFGVDRDVSGKGEMTAILYQHARFFPIETGHFW
ncbi:MAG TPA: endonuclease/exonuclease/phosphatase family protein, partial [Candidatus Hydrogenedentes bacterium]|nr:endonuclease/exonuclease/phosphatase family protein [Candidatus Hydrogenedentota bacterium]